MNTFVSFRYIMNQRPLILVTNDDGMYAGGLEALIRVARQFGEVVAISSGEPMSGMSHAITIKVPLRVRLVSEEPGLTRYVCNGTPVDGVKLIFNSLSDRRPDLLLSGINHGSNSSSSVLYSGTMAAAMEVRVYTVSVGRGGQVPMPVTTRDPFTGQIVERIVTMEVQVDEKLLQRIAERTGGEFFRATDPESLRQIFARIDELEKTEIEHHAFRRYRDLHHPVQLAAAALLALAALVWAVGLRVAPA